MSEQASADTFMQILEQTATAVATFTGMKQQYIEAGWSELVAEHMVFEMYRQAGKQSA